jgi:hypothetical protein
MKRIVAFILALSMPLNSFATECSSPVKLLEEGTPTPCRGFLFSPQKELDLRLLSQNYDLQTQELDATKKIVQKYQQKDSEYETIIQKEVEQRELWRVRAEDATKKSVEANEGRTGRDVLCILSGAAAVILGALAVKWAAKQ